MSNYLEKYREALREGDEEKANKYYRKYRDGEEVDSEPVQKAEDESEEEPETKFEAPSSMTVSEAKDYVSDLPEEDVEAFLESERENKDRATLVEHLEKKVE